MDVLTRIGVSALFFIISSGIILAMPPVFGLPIKRMVKLSFIFVLLFETLIAVVFGLITLPVTIMGLLIWHLSRGIQLCLLCYFNNRLTKSMKKSGMVMLYTLTASLLAQIVCRLLLNVIF